ncbi:hypothetical protein DLREEDagrD3_23620 [Denitratisoma sp. agr-D3]
MIELIEREFDLRLRLEELEIQRCEENAQERAHTGAQYAKVKADLAEVRKAAEVATKVSSAPSTGK